MSSENEERKIKERKCSNFNCYNWIKRNKGSRKQGGIVWAVTLADPISLTTVGPAVSGSISWRSAGWKGEGRHTCHCLPTKLSLSKAMQSQHDRVRASASDSWATELHQCVFVLVLLTLLTIYTAMSALFIYFQHFVIGNCYELKYWVYIFWVVQDVEKLCHG